MAIREFHKLLDKKFHLEILSALQTMLRKWIVIKMESNSLPPSEISRLVGQHEFVVKKTLEKMRHRHLDDLIKLKLNLTNAEYKIKSGELEPILAIEMALSS